MNRPRPGPPTGMPEEPRRPARDASRVRAEAFVRRPYPEPDPGPARGAVVRERAAGFLAIVEVSGPLRWRGRAPFPPRD